MNWLPIRENPVAHQQFSRFRRFNLFQFLLLLVVWVAVAWTQRTGMLASMGVGGGAMLFGQFMFSFFPFLLRPDLLVALLLMAWMTPYREWVELRCHLALSRLTPRELVAGICVVPWTLLVGMNIIAGPLSYWWLLHGTNIGLGTGFDSRLWGTIAGLAMALFAITEDLLYVTALSLLIAMQRLRGLSLDRALPGIAWRLLLLGFATGAIGLILFAVQMSLFGLLFGSNSEAMLIQGLLLLTEILPFCGMIAILLIELWVIRRWWRAGLRAADEWLRGEE